MVLGNCSRRELLAAFLGVGAAALAAGCGGGTGSKSALPPGELAGASDAVGHWLRDGVDPEPAPDAWRDVDVVIAGGGMAGLTAAWRLTRAGFTNFVLLELEPEAGGTARGGASPLTSYPWGAHYIPAPRRENAALIRLLDEMGIVEGRDADGHPRIAEQALCREPEERLFLDGRWHDGLFPHSGADGEDLRQYELFRAEMGRWAEWRDAKGRRAFDFPIAACSDDAEVTVLDRMTMADYLASRGYTSPRLRWYVEYACRDDFGSTLEQTSAWAGIFYFASHLRDSHSPPQPLMTWPDGNGRVVRHFSKTVGERIRTGLVVTRITPRKTDADRSEVIAAEAATRRAVGFRARHVICALPQFVLKRAVLPWRADPPAHVREFEYSAWMVANLHLTGRPAPNGFPFAWDNVLYDSPSLGYVVATHQRGIDHGPTVWTYYYPLCDADPRAARMRLLQAGRDEWAEVALTDLGAAHPDLRPLVSRLDVMRWGHAMVRPRPGFMWSAARRQARTPFGGLHFAHSDLSGVALFEEAFDHGLRAAEEVLAATGWPLKERWAAG